MNETIYTTEDIAQAAGISPARVRRIAIDYKRGRVVGRQWLFDQNDYDWYITRPDHRRKESKEAAA